MNNDKNVFVGKVSSPHGIKGWLKVISYTDPIENILSYKEWFIINEGGSKKTFSIEDSRIQGKKIIVKLDGIEDRDGAEDLNNKEILVSRIDLPKLEENTFYWNDLLDLSVLDQKGKQIGKVDSLFETGSNDVLVIVNENKERFLVPFIMEEVIRKVDLVKEFISIDWPEIE
tara:strand:+ start:128 stop:643 length:516 start_codon:yes stop_codon:yes gene_type:complete